LQVKTVQGQSPIWRCEPNGSLSSGSGDVVRGHKLLLV
jgi:hypothetical protein